MSMGFMSGHMACHGIVSIASCCLYWFTILALCGLALSSMWSGRHASGWLSKCGTTISLSTESRYICPFIVPLRTYRSSLHLREKQSHRVTPPEPNALVGRMLFSLWAVLICLQTLMRPSTSRKRNRLSSDQWIFCQFRIFHRRWSFAHWSRAWRWCGDK